MTKSVLFAGVLGGLLGGFGGYALLRTLPSTLKSAQVPDAPRSEARALADELVAKLKAGKNDEFLAIVRSGFNELTDDQFGQLGLQMKTMRSNFTSVYGAPSEFEFVRETTFGRDAVRFAYTEKFPRGCVVWSFTYYASPSGWQVSGFQYRKLDSAFESGL